MLASLFVRRALSTSAFRTGYIHINHEFHNIIKWTRPDKVKPWDPQSSGDLKAIEEIDPTWLKYEYRDFEAEINEQVPEEFRRLFTVEFMPRNEAVKCVLNDTVQKIRRHDFDTNSWEVKIARLTVKIRNIVAQLQNIEYFLQLKFPRKTRGHLRKTVKELIDKRKQYLTILRNSDYKRFEWLLEELSILYRPNIMKWRIERKMSLRILVNMHCHALRQQKMNEYKQELEAQKVPFLEEKLAALEEIKIEEETFNLPCSVSTEIEDTKKRLEALKNDYLVIQPIVDTPQTKSRKVKEIKHPIDTLNLDEISFGFNSLISARMFEKDVLFKDPSAS